MAFPELSMTKVQMYLYDYSGSKKGSSGHMNRSSSADSSSRVPWMPQGGMGAMPCQPIAQDPSMPPIPPPNTRVQLEEVNRRLNAGDAFSNVPIKSKYVHNIPTLSFLEH